MSTQTAFLALHHNGRGGGAIVMWWGGFCLFHCWGFLEADNCRQAQQCHKLQHSQEQPAARLHGKPIPTRPVQTAASTAHHLVSPRAIEVRHGRSSENHSGSKRRPTVADVLVRRRRWQPPSKEHGCAWHARCGESTSLPAARRGPAELAGVADIWAAGAVFADP